MTVGIVIGAGIFRVPADVAAAVAEPWAVLGLWLIGGLAALTGALCYAELGTRFPSMGGEYHYLRLAFGERLGAWFVWARVSVMQTGAIATVAFVAGDYIASLWPGGPTTGWWAAISVIVVTLANLVQLEVGRRGQQVTVGVVLLVLLVLVVAGIMAEPQSVPATGDPLPGAGIGLALVFVMLAYGGWNEAAYLSAEVRSPAAMVRALLGGLGLVTLIYLLFNWALLNAFGHQGLAGTPAPATALAEALLGPAAMFLIGAGVIAAALSTMNATTITGARAMAALGQTVPALALIGRFDRESSVPRPALLVQGLVALALTAYGATTRDGFSAMVAFGAPVFWLFLALTAVALFRLRRLYPKASGFSVPLYPLIPLIFLAATLYMLWSAFGYAGFLLGQSEDGRLAGFLGLFLFLAGLPLAWKAGTVSPSPAPREGGSSRP